MKKHYEMELEVNEEDREDEESFAKRRGRVRSKSLEMEYSPGKSHYPTKFFFKSTKRKFWRKIKEIFGKNEKDGEKTP